MATDAYLPDEAFAREDGDPYSRADEILQAAYRNVIASRHPHVGARLGTQFLRLHARALGLEPGEAL